MSISCYHRALTRLLVVCKVIPYIPACFLIKFCQAGFAFPFYRWENRLREVKYTVGAGIQRLMRFYELYELGLVRKRNIN